MTRLPRSWIDRIWTRLIARWGREFSERYSRMVEIDGNVIDMGIEAAKVDWAETLSFFLDKPEEFLTAVQNFVSEIKE